MTTDNQTPVLPAGGVPPGSPPDPLEERLQKIKKWTLRIMAGAMAASIVIHIGLAVTYKVLDVLNPTTYDKPERFVEIDLRNYKSPIEQKAKEKPVKLAAQPTVRPPEQKPLPEKPQAVPTLPPPAPERVRIAARPTDPPKPEPEATKPPEIKPTPEQTPERPKATPEEPKATPEKPEATQEPPKIAANPTPPKPRVPENIPEPGKRAAGQPSPGRNNDTTRLDPNKPAQRYAGLLNQPKPGDGAPRGPGKPRYDEKAGAAPGNREAGRAIGKPQPGTRPRRSSGLDNIGVDANAQGGQGNAPREPLRRGIRTGDRLARDLGPEANFNSAAPGRPGGGTSGLGKFNNGGGSPRGNDPDLAGIDGGGDRNAIKGRMARRGGGGGTMDTIMATEGKRLADQDVVETGGPGRGPGRGGGSGGGRGGGTGRNAGDGHGVADSGPARAALNLRPGSGLGSGPGAGTGGPRGGGRGGEKAGDGGSGGGVGGGTGGGVGSGRGGGGGGGRGPRYARGGGRYGDPFGQIDGGNTTGGGGTGGGPGGPGRGTRIARRGGNGPGDGDGDGEGLGNGGNGNGFGRGKGRGAGGLGIGPGRGGGTGSGDGSGPGIGGGNGSGGGGRGNGGRGGKGDLAGSGDGDGSISGRGTGRRLGKGSPRLASRGDAGAIIGRGLMRKNGEGGIDGYYYEDTDLTERHYETLVFEMEQSGNWKDIPIDWKPFVKSKRHRVDKTIQFNWGEDPPFPGMRNSFYSVRWVGKIFVPKDDNYRFQFKDLDDGGRLYLDGEKIIDVWKVQKSSPSTLKSYRLSRGAHDIVIEYVQGPPTEASVTLMWMSASFPWEVVGEYIPGN